MSVLKLQAVKALSLLLLCLSGRFATGVGKVNSFVMPDKVEDASITPSMWSNSRFVILI